MCMFKKITPHRGHLFNSLGIKSFDQKSVKGSVSPLCSLLVFSGKVRSYFDFKAKSHLPLVLHKSFNIL